MSADAGTKAAIFLGGAFVLYLFAKKMNVIKSTTGTVGGGVNIGGGTQGTAPAGTSVVNSTSPGGANEHLIAATAGATAIGGTMGATSGTVGIADPTGAATLSAWRTPVRIQNPDGTITEAFAI